MASKPAITSHVWSVDRYPDGRLRFNCRNCSLSCADADTTPFDDGVCPKNGSPSDAFREPFREPPVDIALLTEMRNLLRQIAKRLEESKML